ncbi:MAG: DUF2807 domain-containing protein [Bacteroidales bacterium]|nr:DUF2807 domain-containing protein [Bacteroidales bacterium]
MIRNATNILAICTALAMLSSCRLAESIAPGPTVTHRHKLPQPFDTLLIEGMMDVVLITDSARFAEVECPHNLHNRIGVALCNGNLHLTNDIAHRFLSGYKHIRIALHLPPNTLRSIHLTAPCAIGTADTLRTPQFGLLARSPYVNIDITLSTDYAYISSHWDNAHGEFRMAGRAAYADIEMFEGSNSFDGRLLETETTHIRHYSRSDALLGPCQTLRAGAHGTGSIYYSGEPQMHVEGDSLHVRPLP